MSKHAWEHERTLLGCALLDPTWMPDCVAQADDFTRPPHANLWRLINELHAGGVEAGMMVEVVERVGRKPDDFDGVAYVAAMPNAVPSVEAWQSAARLVAEHGHRVRLRLELARAMEALDHGVSPDEVIAHAEAEMASLALRRAEQGDPWKRIGDVAADVFEQLERNQANPEARMERVIPLPWPSLTRMLRGGMRRGEMMVIAGRPGTGKTAAAMQIVETAAHYGGVLVVSLEMRSDALVERDLARVGEVSHTRMAQTELHDLDWRRLTRAVEAMHRSPVWLMDTPALTARRIAQGVKRKVSRLRAQGVEVRMVMVDYLQLIAAEASAGRADENQLIATISKELTALAKTADVALLAVAQMNRNVEARGETARPRMSDLRGSGQIEQDAAAIVFTANPEDAEMFEAHPDWRSLVVAKARHGVTGEVPAQWVGEHMRLDERGSW